MYFHLFHDSNPVVPCVPELTKIEHKSFFLLLTKSKLLSFIISYFTSSPVHASMHLNINYSSLPGHWIATKELSCSPTINFSLKT